VASLLAFRNEHPPQQIEVEGVAWEYISFGQGDETILFLHGMTGAADIWFQQMVAFGEDYRVIWKNFLISKHSYNLHFLFTTSSQAIVIL